LPTIQDDGCLSFAQYPHIPFPIQRVYYIYGTQPGLARGFHAHKTTRQMMFCLAGSVKLILDDGEQRKDVFLNDPKRGILIDKMVWHEMHDLDVNTILLVLASATYDPQDYIRNYHDFINSLNFPSLI